MILALASPREVTVVLPSFQHSRQIILLKRSLLKGQTFTFAHEQAEKLLNIILVKNKPAFRFSRAIFSDLKVFYLIIDLSEKNTEIKELK